MWTVWLSNLREKKRKRREKEEKREEEREKRREKIIRREERGKNEIGKSIRRSKPIDKRCNNDDDVNCIESLSFFKESKIGRKNE